MNNHSHKRVFRVSRLTIWISSLLIGIMAAIPKFLTLHIKPWDLALDGIIAILFSVFVWHLNIYLLPPYSARSVVPARFINKNLGISLLLGIPVMALLTLIYQLFPMQFSFTTALVMWIFRGIIINLTICLFLFLFYQAHVNRQIGVELEKINAEKVSAQFELLKQQVNPHFLFNSLNTLVAMIETHDKNAPRFVVMLSEFYRSALNKKLPDCIPVEEELNVMNAYRFLLETRFEDELKVNIDISKDHLHSLIPPFTLQLLLENCIKHNVVSREQPLHVNIYSDGAAIVVENDLRVKRSPEPSEGTGLNNITERFQRLLHKQVQILQDEQSFKVVLPV